MRICFGTVFCFPEIVEEISWYILWMLSLLSCSSSTSPWACLSIGGWKSKGCVQLELLRTSCNWCILEKFLLITFVRILAHIRSLCAVLAFGNPLSFMYNKVLPYVLLVSCIIILTSQFLDGQFLCSWYHKGSLALYWAVKSWRRNYTASVIVSCLFTVSFRENTMLSLSYVPAV